MAYERYLKEKINALEELINKSQSELKRAKNSLQEGVTITLKINQLNKDLRKIEPTDSRRDKISEEIQKLFENQANLYWSYFTKGERLEIRNISLIAFEKIEKINPEKIFFEKLTIEYGNFINKIVNGQKNIWWVNNEVLKRRKDFFLELLREEFEKIISQRRKIILLPRERIEKQIKFFEEEKNRKWYANEEFKNLTEFKILFNQIHDNYRENVFFI